jgi:hypothetical protein
MIVSSSFVILHEAKDAQATENEKEDDDDRRNEDKYPIEGNFTF